MTRIVMVDDRSMVREGFAAQPVLAYESGLVRAGERG